MINLYTKYEASTLTHNEDMKGHEKCKNWDGLGDQGYRSHQQQNHLIEHI